MYAQGFSVHTCLVRRTSRARLYVLYTSSSCPARYLLTTLN